MVTDCLEDSFEQLQSELRQGSIVPNVTAEEIRHHLVSRYDFGRKMSLDDVVADVEQMMRKWHVQITHPRYFGLFNPSVTLASVVADTLVAMYNPQLANWRTAPAANEIERHTLNWLAGKFGISSESAATFTSGGMEANLSAIIVALTRAFPEYGEHGLHSLSGLPTIYLTREAHHGYNKIAHIAGLGRAALRIVKTDETLKLDQADLERLVDEDRSNGLSPFLVVGTAGTTGTGIIDPLPAIAEFCRNSGIWFHADAAWGGAAILSPALKHHLAGIESADSITCDAHKWFSVPMGAGMFFCQHPDSVSQAFRADVTYMAGKKTGPVCDPLASSIQWSRRFIGLKFFLALSQLGEAGYIEMIEHQAAMGRLLRDSLTASGWRIVNDTPLPLVCFTRDGLDVIRFLETLHERQIAWMSPVTIGSSAAVRACITSFRTTATDVLGVVEEMNEIVDRPSASLVARV